MQSSEPSLRENDDPADLAQRYEDAAVGDLLHLDSKQLGAFERLAGFQSHDQSLSTSRGESGILVDVHPGLLSRASNDLAATTFPRSAWVNNLLRRHS